MYIKEKLQVKSYNAIIKENMIHLKSRNAPNPKRTNFTNTSVTVGVTMLVNMETKTKSFC